LAEKLLQIRDALGLSQSEMLRRLGKDESGHRNFISDYELGKRVPSLLEVLAYARAAGVTMDVLVDDNLALPGQMSNRPKEEKAPRQVAKKRGQKK
jgi:transcriptional regulator with XRE-family HTH domain